MASPENQMDVKEIVLPAESHMPQAVTQKLSVMQPIPPTANPLCKPTVQAHTASPHESCFEGQHLGPTSDSSSPLHPTNWLTPLPSSPMPCLISSPISSPVHPNPPTNSDPVLVSLAPEITLEPRMIYCWLDGLRIKVHKADFARMALKWKTRLTLSPPKSKVLSDEEDSPPED
jgi:hypothetical protein